MSHSGLNSNSGDILPSVDANRWIYVNTSTERAIVDNFTVNTDFIGEDGLFNNLTVNSALVANFTFNNLTVNSDLATNGVFRLFEFTNFQNEVSSYAVLYVSTLDQILKSKQSDGSEAWINNRMFGDRDLVFTVTNSDFLTISARNLDIQDSLNTVYNINVESIDISSQDSKGFLNGVLSGDISSGDVGNFYYCFNHSSDLNAVFVDSSISEDDFTIPNSFTHFRKITNWLEVD